MADSGQVALARLDTETETWVSMVGLRQKINGELKPVMTDDEVDLEFYLGDLHLVARNLGFEVIGTDDDSIWYASCELPCEAPLEFTTGDWTRIVRQDGSATSAVALEQYGTQGDNLWMLHRIEDPSDPGTFTFGYRGKKSK